MDELTRRRMEHNEQVFRSVNEEIDDHAELAAELDYVCECADATCSSTVRLTREDYRRVRSGPDLYFVLPEHFLPELERLVERNPGWLIVEKL